MSFLLQLRGLKLEVRRQLDELKDAEKGRPIDSEARGSDRIVQESEDGKSQKEDESDDNSNGAEDPYASIPGIEPRTYEDGTKRYIVSWTSPDDPKDPHNWSTAHRLKTTILLFLIAFVVTCASSIDSAVLIPASKDLRVSEVTETLGGTGIYLIGFGAGALVCSPLSELIGRYPTYLGASCIFGIWIMAAGLAPNSGAQIVFRGLAGFCASAPLTVAGGSISDIWNPNEKTWAFPLFAISGFGGPVLGPVISAYIGYTGVVSWRWSEWTMLMFDGLIIFSVVALKQETLAPRLLKYKAAYFRKSTGDNRFKSEVEAKGHSLAQVLKTSFSRPFILALEPIVLAFTIYLTVIYIVLFTFLDGYAYIFGQVHGINSGLTYAIFVALFIGILLQTLTVPIVHRQTMRQLVLSGDDGSGKKIKQEMRLLFAMYGAPFIPIGLFWMAWTDFKSTSIWSPILASLPIGFGIIGIFLSAYMYIIDSYEMYAASALTFVALVRYFAAGGMTVVGVPMYKNLGPRYALTILACISAAVVPIPYALFRWGPKVREKSKYAVSPGT